MEIRKYLKLCSIGQRYNLKAIHNLGSIAHVLSPVVFNRSNLPACHPFGRQGYNLKRAYFASSAKPIEDRLNQSNSQQRWLSHSKPPSFVQYFKTSCWPNSLAGSDKNPNITKI